MPNQFRKFGLETIRSHRELNSGEWLRDRPYLMKWFLWLGIPSMVLLPTGLGIWAVLQLFGLPDLPKCLTVSWSDDNPANRLYCANISAHRNTPSDLQEAIRMVNAIPRDEPLRAQADRLIRQWTEEILRLGEAAYQDGKLTEAIAIAEQVPYNVPTRAQAEDRIQVWKDVWDRAEALYQQGQAALSDKNWFGAISAARQMLALGNRYWATTKHEALMQEMEAAKAGQQKQKQTQATPKQAASPVQDYLTRLKQEEAVTASAHLSKAQKLASAGDLDSLRAAVEEAQQIIFGSDGYDAAQQAMSEWRHQIELIEDRPYLDRAIALANQGDEDSLQAAIAEASQIGWGRALYDEANQQVEQWRDRVFQLQAEARARQLEAMTGRPQNTYQPAALPAANPPADANPQPAQAGSAIDQLPPAVPDAADAPLLPASP